MVERFSGIKYIEDITWWREDKNFMFEWQEQYLTHSLRSLVRYCSCHSNIKFVSSRHRVISSIYRYCVRCKHLRKWYTPKNGVDILHSYLPITATSVKRPLSSVPRVAFVERFDCITCISLCSYCFLSRDLIGLYKLLQCSCSSASFTGTWHRRKGRSDQRFVGTVRIVVSSHEFFLH